MAHFHPAYTTALLFLSAIIGAVVTMGHKTFLKKYDIYTITYIDTILTCIFLSAYAIYHRGIGNIYKQYTTISVKDRWLFVIFSIAIAGLVVVGRRLLKHNDMSYLGIMNTGIDVLVTVAVGVLFLNEKLTTSKVAGLAVILLGTYIVNR